MLKSKCSIGKKIISSVLTMLLLSSGLFSIAASAESYVGDGTVPETWSNPGSVLSNGEMSEILLDEETGAYYISDEIIVQYAENVTETEKDKKNAEKNTEKKNKIEKIKIDIVKIKDKTKKAKDVLKEYKSDTSVLSAELNYVTITNDVTIVPNDPLYASRQTQLPYLNAPSAWYNASLSTVVVAVIDSGVFKHSDLGTIMSGYNFYDGNTTIDDNYGHGTKVSGVIAAKGNNGLGIAGVNWNAAIMPVKVSGSTGTGTVTMMANGIIYAADNGAKVINISMGTTANSITLQNAVNYAYSKGCAIFAATGNSGTVMSYPAAYESVMSVGSTADGVTRWSGSNYSAGLDVVSINTFYTTQKDGTYNAAAGTSLACPQVAGLASLLFAINPSATVENIYQYIKMGCTDIGAAGYDPETGYGLINLDKSIKLAYAAIGKTPPSDSTAITTTKAPTTTTAPTTTKAPTTTPTTTTTKAPTTTTAAPTTTTTKAPTTIAPTTTVPMATAPTTTEEVLDLGGDVKVPIVNTYTGTIAKAAENKKYTINAPNGGAIDLNLAFTGGGNADLSLVLYNEKGTAVASATSKSKPETIRYTVKESGTYTVEVKYVKGTSNYTLVATYEEAGVPLESFTLPTSSSDDISGTTTTIIIIILALLIITGAIAIFYKFKIKKSNNVK